MKRICTPFAMLIGILLSSGLWGQAGKSLNFRKDNFGGSFKFRIALDNGFIDNSNYNPTTIVIEAGKVVVFQMYSIDKLVEEDIAEGDPSNQADINDRFLRKYKLVFPRAANNSSNPAVLDRVDDSSPELSYIKDNRAFKVAEIRYRITGYGRTRIDVGIDVVKQGTNSTTASKSYSFEVIVNEPLRPIDQQWIELKAGGLSRLCAYLSNEPQGLLVPKATKEINDLAQIDWNKTKDQAVKVVKEKNNTTQEKIRVLEEKIKIYKSFQDKYEDCRGWKGNHLSDVASVLEDLRKQLAALRNVPGPPTPPPPVNKEEALWKTTHKSKKIELYQDFVKAFPSGKYAKEAKDSILRLTPISISAPQKAADGSMVLTFDNLLSPSYIADGLNVSEKLDGHTLILTVQKPNGKYDIVVTDTTYPWKTVTLHLDNLFEPKMDLLKDEFTINFKGGEKPYKIQILDPVSLIPVWTRGGLTEASKTVTFDELRKEKLQGKFKVYAYDLSVPESSVALGDIDIPSTGNKVLILMTIGLLAVIGAMIYFMLKLSKRKNTSIFDEVQAPQKKKWKFF